MGELITLTGSNFGEMRDDSYITIAGTSPTFSSYHTWQDNLIIVRVPELGESGLVYVHSRGKKSNGVLFSNTAVLPKPVEGEAFGLEPRITSVNPQTGVPGSIITINGINFGNSRDIDYLSTGGQTGGGVFFSWDFEAASFNPYVGREAEFIEVSETEFGYESWSSREIRVRVPDGVVSGSLEVRTPNGISRSVFFDVSGKPGTKTFREKRSYTINYSVDIRVLNATRPNNLYLWMPKPITSSSQRNINPVSRNFDPFVENYRGVSLFKLENLTSGVNQSVNLSFYVEVYAVETEIRPLSIRQERSSIATSYTQNSNLIPSDDPEIKAVVNTIIGREQNPYIKGRMLYDWIINNIEINEISFFPAPAGTSAAGLTSALEERQTDSCNAALLYAAMVRAAGLPCIPIAGILINSNGQTIRHYWVEYWIDGFGWVPVDPAMGAGAVPYSYITKEDYFNYYYGNLDSNRIAFSRGELNLSQMESRGRVVYHTQSYSLQNIWEEAVGGLESYSSFWSDIIISGVYIQ